MLDKESLKKFAEELSVEYAQKIGKHSDDAAYAASALQDLKLQVIRRAADLAGFDASSSSGMDLLWNAAHNMPDFSPDIFSSRRMSAISLGCAVLLGWLLGGVCSGLLGLVNMGGDILRPLAIFMAVWLQDYFAVNASARKYFLKIFGWTALAGIAARVCAGILRFGAGLRAIFPLGAARPGIFRAFWLALGLCVIFVLFSGKRGKADKELCQKALAAEIESRLVLLCLFFEEIADRENHLQALLADAGDASAVCRIKDCELAHAVMELMDFLTESQKSFLLRKLQKLGFKPVPVENNKFVWNGERDGKLYETVGLVKDGDVCLVLVRPAEYDGIVKKGLVQRLD